MGLDRARALRRKHRALVWRRVKRGVEGLVYRCLGLFVRPWLKPRPPSLPPRRVLLVLRAQRFGDAVVSLAFSAAVKRAFGEVEIWAAGPPALEPVLGCDSSLAGFLPVPHPAWRRPREAVRAWRDLRRMGFDLAFVLATHSPSAALGRFCSHHSVGYDYNGRGLCLDRALVPDLSCNRSGWEYGVEDDPPHITRFWAHLLETVTGQPTEVSWKGLDLAAHGEAVRVLLAPVLAQDRRLVVFHPFAGNPIRSWPQSHSRRFVERIVAGTDWALVVGGGPADVEQAQAVAGQASNRVVVTAGRLGLAECWALVARSDLLVSVDSVPIHMGAAVGTPVVSLFGAGDPLVWGPWGQEAGVLQANAWCQRCKRARCLHPGLPCLEALDPERVLDRAREMIGTGPLRH